MTDTFPPLKIYYAHPMVWYGTKDEAADIERLAYYGTVENPNSALWNTRVDKAKHSGYPIMDLFAKHIREEDCDVVCFRRFKDGKLGAGVAREVFEARIWGKVVWEMRTSEFGDVWVDKYPSLDDLYDQTLTVDATRARATNGGQL